MNAVTKVLPVFRDKFRIEKAFGTTAKWAVVDPTGYVVENFRTRDEARAYLNRQPARKAEPQPTANV